MYKCVLIENDNDTINFISNSINKTSFKIIATFSTVQESFLFLETNTTDIVFLDIELDDGNGFDLLDKIPKPDFEIIFITGSDNYYKQAFEHFAFSYILKPFTKIYLEDVLNKFFVKRAVQKDKINALASFINLKNSRILFNDGSEHHSLLINDILYLKSDGNYSEVFSLGAKPKITSNGNLSYYSKLLEHKGFFRASRYYLVNITHIVSIYKKEFLKLTNNEKIKVSKRNKLNLLRIIEELS